MWNTIKNELTIYLFVYKNGEFEIEVSLDLVNISVGLLVLLLEQISMCNRYLLKFTFWERKQLSDWNHQRSRGEES